MHALTCSRRSSQSSFNLFAICSALLLLALTPLAALGQTNDEGDGPSDMDIRRTYSLYTEDYNNENWESAAPNLRWMLEHAPTEPFQR